MSKTVFDVATFRNEGKPVMFHLLRQVYLIGGRPTRNRAFIILRYLKIINELYKHGGSTMVVKYLKGCAVLLQQVIAGYNIPDTGALGMRISRTRSGIPRIIPPKMRGLIRAGNTFAIRFWLTLFNVYRVLHCEGRLKLETIIGPCTGSIIDVSKSIGPFCDLFTKGDPLILKPGMPFEILKSSPQAKGWQYSTIFQSLIKSLWIMKNYHPSLMESWLYLVSYSKSTLTKTLYLRCSAILERTKVKSQKLGLFNSLLSRREVSSYISKIRYIARTTQLGALGVKDEPAGKVRVFAMVDPWTQWALKPLHDWLFKILNKHSMDGTFNQLKPLKSVPFGETQIDSLDLSAATDRLPLWIQAALLNRIFGPAFAYHWQNLLVNRDYNVSRLLRTNKDGQSYLSHYIKPYDISSSDPLKRTLVQYVCKGVRYAVGQPMGALSSWAMLALTHHFIIQHSAWETGSYSRSTLFTKYAVLGDDVVIWDKRVSLKYQEIMATLGVGLGIAKSVISPEGLGLEFAKRTLYKGQDVSPAPIKEAIAAHRNVSSALELKRKYSLTSLQLIRFLGYGHKVVLKGKSLQMKLLRFILEMPTSGLSMRDLVIPQPLLWGRENYYGLKLQRRAFVRTLLILLKDLQRRIEAQHRGISHYAMSMPLYASSIYNPLPDFLNISFDEQDPGGSVIFDVQYRIRQQQIERAMEVLLSEKQRVKSNIWMVEYLTSQILGPYYLIPPFMDDPAWSSCSRNLLNISNSLFDIEKNLASISPDSIIHPYREAEKPKVLDYESKVTLRFWNRWIKVMLKSQELNNL